MAKFCTLRAKAYAYKSDDDTEKKKAKGTKKCKVKRETTFKNYVDALFNDEVIIKFQQRFRTQTFDRVATFPYGMNVLKICEN